MVAGFTSATPRNSVLNQIPVPGEDQILDDPAVDQVFLDDALEDRRATRVVPDTLGIDDGDGSLGADSEAVDLAAIDERLGTGEI